MSVIIAKNQTAGALAISQLPIPNQEIPASGQVTLTDYASVSEVQSDDELKAYIANGDVILNDGTNDMSTFQSLLMVTTSTEQTGVGGTFDQTYGLAASDGSLAGTTDTVYASVFEPTKSMTLTDIEWYCVTGTTGDVHVGIYNEAKDTLLAYGVTTNASSNTFNKVTLNTSVLLAAGEKYYPAIMQEDGGFAWAYSTVSPNVGLSVYTTWNQQNLPPSIASAAGSGYASWFGFYGTLSTIVTERSVYADFYDSGTTAVSSVATVLTLNTTRQSNPAFVLSSNEVTVQADGGGDYCVTYAVTFSESDPTIRVTQTWLEVNGTEVPATRGVVGHWATGGNGVDGTCGRTCILTLAAGDDVRVMGQVTYNAAGYDTITGGVGLTIHSIGADGEPGPPGPAGSGSTVIIQDSGVALPSTPHSTLNFVGRLSATNSGGSVAEIALTGDAAFASYYNSASYQGITTSASTLPLDTTQHANAAFTLASNEVTVNTASTYRIDYDLSLDESSSNDATVDMWLELDGGGGFAEVGGTRARMFHDSNMEEGGNHGMAILTLAANDVLRIRAQVVGGSSQMDTLANGTRFLIQTIGADGADGPTGPQGPAGSGSTVTIEDEGTAIANTPHSNLNFTGAGVTASDAGGGVATINIPGSTSSANVAQYRRSTDQTINTSSTTISLDATDFEDSNFSRSGSDITVQTDGVYRVSYSVYFDTNTNARRTVDAWVENNGTEIVPSRSSSYARNTTDDTSNSAATFLVDLAQNDIVTLRAQSTGTNGTALGKGDRIWIVLEYVRAP